MGTVKDMKKAPVFSGRFHYYQLIDNYLTILISLSNHPAPPNLSIINKV